jgi:arsenate reductase
MTVYGIPNCDTVKKATVWLKENKIDYEFHDYKKAGITKTKLADWCKIVGWEVLLNKKSSTWKKLSLEEQQSATNQTAAIKIMFENNSIIKRPVIEFGNTILVGFNEGDYQKKLIPMK